MTAYFTTYLTFQVYNPDWGRYAMTNGIVEIITIHFIVEKTCVDLFVDKDQEVNILETSLLAALKSNLTKIISIK